MRRFSTKSGVVAIAVGFVGVAALVISLQAMGKREGYETAHRFFSQAVGQDYDAMRSSKLCSAVAIERLKESETNHGKMLRFKIVEIGCQIGGQPWFARAVVWRTKGIHEESVNGYRRYVIIHSGSEHAKPLVESQLQDLFRP